MREKVIAGSAVCCLLLIGHYIRKKVFVKKLPDNEVLEEAAEVKEGDQV